MKITLLTIDMLAFMGEDHARFPAIEMIDRVSRKFLFPD
jgi:hypothetical protein